MLVMADLLLITGERDKSRKMKILVTDYNFKGSRHFVPPFKIVGQGSALDPSEGTVSVPPWNHS